MSTAYKHNPNIAGLPPYSAGMHIAVAQVKTGRNDIAAPGIIVKPWKDPGFSEFISVTIGLPAANGRILDALGELAANRGQGQRSR